MTTEEKRRKNAERSKKWREEHPGYMKDYMKDYRVDHLEEMRAADRAYHDAHKEECNRKRREWAKANPEKDRLPPMPGVPLTLIRSVTPTTVEPTASP